VEAGSAFVPFVAFVAGERTSLQMEIITTAVFGTHHEMEHPYLGLGGLLASPSRFFAFVDAEQVVRPLFSNVDTIGVIPSATDMTCLAIFVP
jgi:hypothetical protein